MNSDGMLNFAREATKSLKAIAKNTHGIEEELKIQNRLHAISLAVRDREEGQDSLLTKTERKFIGEIVERRME